MTLRIARRGALLLVAAALAAGPVVLAPAAGAATTFGCASGEPCVHITFPDGGHPAVDVPASAVDSNSGNEDVLGPVYTFVYASGTTSYPVNGVSLNALLSSVIPNPIDTDSVQYLVITQPGTVYQSTLRKGDLDNPAPFAGGLEPVFAVSGSDTGIEYDRPQRDANDVNGPDRFQTGDLYPVIDLAVHTAGALVHPTLNVGAGPWRAGDAVTFSASFASDDPPHAGANFAWTFAVGDPATPGRRSTTHTYSAQGTYTASVAVSGNDPNGGTYYGQSPGVPVQVGKAPPTKPGGNPPGGNGTGGQHHPKSGPRKSHGGHHAGSSPTRMPTVAPSTTPPTNPVRPTGGSGPTGSAAPSTAVAAPTAGPTEPAQLTTPPVAHAGSGAFVQGVLIDQPAVAGGVQVSAPSPGAVSARRPARADTSFDARWLWVLAPIVLLVGGALGERRRVPGRHGPQSRV